MSDEEHREMDLFDNELGVIVQLRKSEYEGAVRLKHEEMRVSLSYTIKDEKAGRAIT